MKAKYIVALVAALAVVGFAAPALAVSVSDVIENPRQFEGEKITITAPIAENMVPEGGEYRTWSFVLDSCDPAGGLTAVESGFNPETIEKGYRLVEAARLRGDQVTVTGKLEKDDSGLKFDVDSVQYGMTLVKTDEGPFIEDYYGDDVYPGTPRFYEGHAYYGRYLPEVEPPPPQQRYARISGCPMEK